MRYLIAVFIICLLFTPTSSDDLKILKKYDFIIDEIKGSFREGKIRLFLTRSDNSAGFFSVDIEPHEVSDFELGREFEIWIVEK